MINISQLEGFPAFAERFRRRLRICPRADKHSPKKPFEPRKKTSQLLTLGIALVLAGPLAAKAQNLPTYAAIGGLKAEYFTNITGILLTDLTSHGKFLTNAPDIVEVATQFESRSEWADNYGARLSGWLIPPTTGNYRFYLASDDQGALFLSTNATATSMKQIAFEPQWNGAREFITGQNQASRGAPATNVSGNIALTAGNAYYVEALFKEGTGGDHLAVAWLPPGGPAITNGAAPIPGKFLASGTPFVGGFQPLATASLTNSGQIGVSFGRLLDQASATVATNYAVIGATVTGAVLSPDRQGVLLTVSGLAGSTFTLWAGPVKDVFGNWSTPAQLTGSVLPQFRQDVGTAGDPLVTGTAFSSRAGEFDVVAGGSDIWDTADHLHFVYEQRTGDFDMQVRVESLEAVDRWAKAGLMVRETLSAGSRHLMANVTPVGPTRDGAGGGQGLNTYELLLRSTANQATGSWATNAAAANVSYPNAWIRLQREGNTFKAYRGTDGANWTLLGQTNQTYPSTVSVGVATTSHNNAPGYTALARYRSYGDFIIGPPHITSQPQSISVAVGATASFQVTASGTFPLSYQWRKGGSPQLGATTTSFALTNVQPTDAGNFDVVVTSPSGSVTSLVAVLTVDLLPHITSQPQNMTVPLGSNATFQVTAAGLPPLTYQWRKDGAPLSGATDTSYTVADVQPPTAGSYDVVVGNTSGSVTSAPAALNFTVPPPVLASLQWATADTPPFSNSYPATAIDGITYGDGGWAGSSNGGPATLVFETETNVGFSNGTMLTFILYQGTSTSSNRNFQLGCFRLSVTTYDRDTFADGRIAGGRVVANWTVLEPFTYTAANQATLTKQADLSLLASGGTDTIDTTYTVTAYTPLMGITGFRLEALTNASLPNNGPGRSSIGAFQLQEIQVGVQPAWANPHPQVQVSWSLALANPVQSAAPGSTLNFAGTLNNRQGTPLAIRSVGLFFDTIPATTNWQLTFDPTFLQSASAIPAGGYVGPVFQVTLPAELPTNFFAGGALEVMLEPQQAFGEVTPADEHPLVIQVPFTINGPPLTIERTTAGVVLSWPAAAQDFTLQSTTNLVLPNAWGSVTPTLFRDYNRLMTTLPVDGRPRFFRLKLP